MKITKTSCENCKSKKEKGIGYTWMPKDKDHSGHMDTQMYPECEGTKYDRNIQKKHKKHKKTAQSEMQEHYCTKCGALTDPMSDAQWESNGETCEGCGGRSIKTPTAPSLPGEEMPTLSFSVNDLTVEAKKKSKKKYDPNPWAVCNTTVDKDKDPEKFERCVMDVKKKQASNTFNLSKVAQNTLYDLIYSIQTRWTPDQITEAIKALGEESIAGFKNLVRTEVSDVLQMLEPYELNEIKDWLTNNAHGEIKSTANCNKCKLNIKK